MEIEQGETPIVEHDGRWLLAFAGGAVLLSWRTFDEECGYRVGLMFDGGTAANLMAPDLARRIAARLRNYPDDAALADRLEVLAAECDWMNGAWATLGRPSEGITEGHA